MTRLLIILVAGLICEAIGVVFLSRGLKEVVSLFSCREILDPDSLSARLSTRADGVSELLWHKLSDQQQARLTGTHASAKEKRRLLVGALNDWLRGDPARHEEHFAGIQLGAEARRLLAQPQVESGRLRLNRLLLEDAYPGELAKSKDQPVNLSQVLSLAGRGLTNTHILLGVFFEALFFIGLLMLMSKADVSFVWPLTSLGFVITTLAARIYLHEEVSALRWSGVCLIMMGAALITWTEKQASPAPASVPVSQSSDAPLK